jgi:hypothetical protein
MKKEIDDLRLKIKELETGSLYTIIDKLTGEARYYGQAKAQSAVLSGD